MDYREIEKEFSNTIKEINIVFHNCGEIKYPLVGGISKSKIWNPKRIIIYEGKWTVKGVNKCY